VLGVLKDNLCSSYKEKHNMDEQEWPTEVKGFIVLVCRRGWKKNKTRQWLQGE